MTGLRAPASAAPGLGAVSRMVLITVAVPAMGAAQAAGAGRTVRSGRRKARRDPGRDADQALAVLYEAHCRSLTRLATLLLNDVAVAEGVVRASFAGMHHAWRRQGTADQGLLYLRRAVVRRARSHRPAHPAPPGPQPPETAGLPAAPPPESRLPAALWALPTTQREAVVLRYYVGLPDSEIASVMGISARSVSGHIERAVATLRGAIGPGHAASARPQ